MRLTWRDTASTLITGGVVTGYVGLVTQAPWAPVSSVRWFSALYLAVGQTLSTLEAADALADGGRGAEAALGPVALAAALTALVTGNVALLAVPVGSMVLLWLLTTSRHALADPRVVGR